MWPANKWAERHDVQCCKPKQKSNPSRSRQHLQPGPPRCRQRRPERRRDVSRQRPGPGGSRDRRRSRPSNGNTPRAKDESRKRCQHLQRNTQLLHMTSFTTWQRWETKFSMRETFHRPPIHPRCPEGRLKREKSVHPPQAGHS